MNVLHLLHGTMNVTFQLVGTMGVIYQLQETMNGIYQLQGTMNVIYLMHHDCTIKRRLNIICKMSSCLCNPVYIFVYKANLQMSNILNISEPIQSVPDINTRMKRGLGLYKVQDLYV